MTEVQWVGAVFVALLIGFLFYAYRHPTAPGQGQTDIIRFICALCGGFGGGFFVGDALFRLDSAINAGTKLGVTGSAGFAFAFAVWYGYGKAIHLPDGYTFRVPSGWSFHDAAVAMVQQENAIIDFARFTDEELKAELRSAEISTKNLRQALQTLGSLAQRSIRPYSVAYQSSRYVLTASG